MATTLFLGDGLSANNSLTFYFTLYSVALCSGFPHLMQVIGVLEGCFFLLAKGFLGGDGFGQEGLNVFLIGLEVFS